MTFFLPVFSLLSSCPRSTPIFYVFRPRPLLYPLPHRPTLRPTQAVGRAQGARDWTLCARLATAAPVASLIPPGHTRAGHFRPPQAIMDSVRYVLPVPPRLLGRTTTTRLASTAFSTSPCTATTTPSPLTFSPPPPAPPPPSPLQPHRLPAPAKCAYRA